ncbi:MAG: M56 family metallopeptidase [Gemmatimonadota bacterium]|nr:M56 family metallopeptidase [Gemmatimonadota bacterium]
MAGIIASYVSTILLTYALHSALACAAALVLGRVLVRDPRDRDILWKATLLLPFLTTSLALGGAGVERGRPMVEVARIAHAAAPIGVRSSVMVRVLKRSGQPDEVVTVVDDPLARGVAIGIVIACVVAAGLSTAANWRRQRGFTRQLRGRRVIDHRGLRLRVGVTLTIADHLDSPVALGRAEICVPAPTFGGMSPAQQRSIIAHELAHLDRRDPAWIAIADCIAGLSAFQPLARLVARSLRRDAEFICDEEAVRGTGDPITLVESLITLAAEMDSASRDPIAVGYDGSPLVMRARRILNGEGARVPSPMRRLRLSVAIAALCAPLLAPTVSTFSHPLPVPPRGMLLEEERIVERAVFFMHDPESPAIPGH